MYNRSLRIDLVAKYNQYIGKTGAVRDSALLQAYATFYALRKLDPDPGKAYGMLWEQYRDCSLQRAICPPFGQEYQSTMEAFLSYSMEEFLTYIVPRIVCDPEKLMKKFRQYSINDPVVCVHHIIQIRHAAYLLEDATRRAFSDSYEDVLDKMYRVYESRQKRALPKDIFLGLYGAINTFQLDQGVIAPHFVGFREKDIETLMSIMADQLQMTRQQQIEMVYRFYVLREQEKQILDNQTLYNFVVCKNEKERLKLANTAIRLIAKIPPMELLCAITTRKLQKTEQKSGLVVPNDIFLETGAIYPIIKSNIGRNKEESVSILFPSIHFVRKLINDPALCGRQMFVVFEDEKVASLLQYQLNKEIYSSGVDKTIRAISLDSFLDGAKGNLISGKVLLFGNHLTVDRQQEILRHLLPMINGSDDLFVLLSAYVMDNAMSPLLRIVKNANAHLKTIALIPQGINNSSHPRRKIWIHCKPREKEECKTKVYSLTLNTSLKTQALSVLTAEPVTLRQDDMLDFDGSIRRLFASEMVARRASGRERNMAFSHELTPDILVWCSRSYPKENSDRPRLEAYVCLPAEPGKESRKGAVITSTKKHTTQVADEDVLEWLEKDYPFSHIQGRYTTKERQAQGTEQSLKPRIYVREEIITNYTPLLQGQNIAIKTLWYLYPDLKDRFTESEYKILCEMMYTAIGQQRVRDLTAEACEQLLMEAYPSLSQNAMWKLYGILTTVMDAAVSLEYCALNPLKEALHHAKIRDKLFAQVRRVMVKKHLSENEMRQLYQFIRNRIEAGEKAYFGVLMRLLTGLESSIICGIRWCDLRYIPEFGITTLVITRQMTLDGKNIVGFNDAEDYLCFPLPYGLQKELEYCRKTADNALQNVQVLGSINCSDKESIMPVIPSELNKLTKNAIAQLRIDERIIDLPDGEDGKRSTNLNKYAGDLIRENFRYWATKSAKMNADELSYLLRSKCPSTLGRFYCDFLGDASQLIMATKLSRWESSISACGRSAGRRYAPVCADTYSKVIQPNPWERQEVVCEVTGSGEMEVLFESEFGVAVEVTQFDQQEDVL